MGQIACHHHGSQHQHLFACSLGNQYGFDSVERLVEDAHYSRNVLPFGGRKYTHWLWFGHIVICAYLQVTTRRKDLMARDLGRRIGNVIPV